MTAERAQSPSDQLSELILNSIKTRRREWGRPLPMWTFNIDLPVLRNAEDSPLPCRETTEELDAASSSFSTQLRSLFDALVACQSLDAEADEEHGPNFTVDGLYLKVETQKQLIDHQPECHHRSYHSNRLTLKDPQTLPQVSSVTKLRLLSATDFENVRPISLRVPLQLLTHLPSIQELECPWLWERMPIAFPASPMRHYSRPWEGPWRDARHEFDRAVQEVNDKIPASLKRARLWFFQPGIAEEDQSIHMPNLMLPASIDPLSSGVQVFASHLEELDLRAFLTQDLFHVKVPWPRMKRLIVEFHPMRPDGSWYFVGPRGEDPSPEGFEVKDEHYPPATASEEDEKMDAINSDFGEESFEVEERRPDMFRTEPSADKIEPLLAAFASRLKATTSLKEAEMFAYLTWYPSDERESDYGDDMPYELGVHRWGVKYTAAQGSSRPSVEWQVGDWRPQGNVLELFEALGGDDGVEMTWKEFEFFDERGYNAEAFV